jgi:hypothetical protein
MGQPAKLWPRKRFVGPNPTFSAMHQLFFGDVAHQVQSGCFASSRYSVRDRTSPPILLGRSPSWSKASGFEPDNSLVRIQDDLPDFMFLVA